MTCGRAEICEGMNCYSKDSLPSDPVAWPEWQKHTVTKAIAIDGPFEVETKEGVLRCQDGFLAIDAMGYPYPIAKDDFYRMYRPSSVTCRKLARN